MVRRSRAGVRLLVAATLMVALLSCDSSNENESVTVSVTPNAISIAVGDQGSVEASAVVTKANDLILTSFSAGSLPHDVQVVFNAPEYPDGSTATATSQATIVVGNDATPGTYRMFIDGSAGDNDGSAGLTLTILPKPDFSFAASPASLTFASGTSAATAITITPLNGFSGGVSMKATGIPTAMSGAFTGSGVNLQLTFTASAGLAAGTYPITVTGTAGTLTHSITVPVTITTPPSLAVSLSPSTVTITQGGSDNATATLTRTAFTGTVTLTNSPLPSGVSLLFSPSSTTANTSILTIGAASSVPAGTYPITITASGPGAQSGQATLQLVVQAAARTPTFDFSSCTGTAIPTAIYWQDGVGTGPWQSLSGTGNVFHTTNAQTTGTLGYLTTSGSLSTISFTNYAASELTGTISMCGTPGTGSGVTMNATAAGLGSGESATFELGGAFGFATQASPLLSFTNVVTGPVDLFGYKSAPGNPALNNRGFMMRNITVNSGINLGPLDFTGANSFLPTSMPITVPGVLGTESLFNSVAYHTGARCLGGSFYSQSGLTSPFTAFGVPASLQTSGDFYGFNIDAHTATSERITYQTFSTLTAMQITLPAALGALNVMPLTGVSYKGLMTPVTIPTVMVNPIETLSYNDAGAIHQFVIKNTSAYMAVVGTAAIRTPDYTGVTPFIAQSPAAGASVSWNIAAVSVPNTSQCTENHIEMLSSQAGSQP